MLEMLKEELNAEKQEKGAEMRECEDKLMRRCG